MIVGAHQPNFLPWLGFLDKVRSSDLFVIVDHVQFERQNFQNRTRVKTRAGPQWLVVPVQQRSRDERIVDKRIQNRRDGRITWDLKIIRTLHHAYRKAPYYKPYQEQLGEILTRPWESLVDLNVQLLQWLMAELEIETPLVRSSELHGVDGARSEMIVSMCRAVDADVYLSGSGGSRTYLELDRFAEEGIEVRWQEFEHPEYAQLEPPAGFAPRMSGIDLLFNHGPEASAILRGRPLASAASRVRPPAPISHGAVSGSLRRERSRTF